jgi:hypothetical protein
MRLGSSFYEKYIKRIRGTMLLEDEKKHLPFCQEFAKVELTIQSMETEWKKGRRKNKDLKKHINTLRRELDENMGIFHTQKKTNSNNDVLCQCPREKCKGFIDDKHGKCGMCYIKVCKKCHEEINDDHDHICDENTLKSIQNIKSNTKPCPKCKIFIHKIEGCDHMWCTMCNTAWEWSTGKIMDTEKSTNPHYYNWLMTQKDYKNVDVDNSNIIDVCIHIMQNLHVKESGIYKIFQILSHVESITIPELQHDNVLPNPIPYRVRYLAGLINDEQWLTHIMKVTKKKERLSHEIDILQKWCNLQREIFRIHIIESIDNIDIDNIIQISKDEISTCNEELSNVAYMYKSKALVFGRTYSYSGQHIIYRSV